LQDLLKQLLHEDSEVSFALEPPGSETNIDGYQATLHVPAESVEAYRSTFPWSNFMNVVSVGY
jgi:hypothetical protein